MGLKRLKLYLFIYLLFYLLLLNKAEIVGSVCPFNRKQFNMRAFGLLQSATNTGGHWNRDQWPPSPWSIYETSWYQWSPMVADHHWWPLPNAADNSDLRRRSRAGKVSIVLLPCLGTICFLPIPFANVLKSFEANLKYLLINLTPLFCYQSDINISHLKNLFQDQK